jgi:hypothetical protein
MPNATVRANARALPESTSYPDASVHALAAQFETALQASCKHTACFSTAAAQTTKPLRRPML